LEKRHHFDCKVISKQSDRTALLAKRCLNGISYNSKMSSD
jgi:hypothetical protein